MRHILGSLIFGLAFVPFPIRATTIELEAPWYLSIDGRYYSVDAGSIEASDDLVTLGTLPTSMTNCRRAGGANQSATNGQLSYTGGSGIVYLAPEPSDYPIEFERGAAVLVLVSATGDVICDGEQLSPTALDNVFFSDFE